MAVEGVISARRGRRRGAVGVELFEGKWLIVMYVVYESARGGRVEIGLCDQVGIL